MSHRLKGLAVAGVVLLGVLGTAAPSGAAESTPDTPATVPVVQPAAGQETVKPDKTEASKAHAAKEIAARLKALAKLSAGVAKTTSDCGQNAALTSELAAETSGLTALASTIKSESDTTKLKAEYTSIFQDYRVFLLETPKTGVVVACDRVKQNSATLTAWIAKAQAGIDKAKDAGADVAAAQAALDAVKPALDAAVAAGSQASAAVLPLVPDKGDKAVRDSNTAALKAALGQIKTARTSLETAIGGARKALATLRSSAAAAPKKESAPQVLDGDLAAVDVQRGVAP